MPIGVLQTVVGTDAAASGATAVVTATVADGSYLDLFICCDNSHTITTPVSVPALTWTLRNALNDAGNAERTEQWTSSITVAGSITITETFSAAATFRGIAVKEVGVSSGYDVAANAKAAQLQAAPTTTADLTTSTNTPALTAQPALVSGWSMATSAGSAGPNVGTGFASDFLGIQVGTGLNLVRGENKRVTSTAAVAATFTALANFAHCTMAVVFLEAVASGVAPKMPGAIWSARNRFGTRTLPAQALGAVSVDYVWAVSGGFTLAGTAPYNKGKVYAVSGGLTFAGTAPYNKGKVYAVSGGLVFGGVATTLYTPAGAVDYVYTPSGGMVFGGTAPYNKGKVFAVSGGLVLGGAAVLLKGKVYAPSGGLVFGGNAVLVKGKVYVVSGGLTFGGVAPYEFSGTVVVAAIRTINSPLNVGTLLNRS